MRWFRTHIDLGSRLALFALAIQLVLSFGHVHLDKRALSSPTISDLQQAANRDGAPGPDRHTGANDFCAVCATIALVASTVVPAGVQLVPPITSHRAWLSDIATAPPAFNAHLPFQARAPPVVG